MPKMKHVALLLLLSSGLHGQNVVTDWAKIVQPAVNTPPKAPAYQMVQRAVIQIAVYDAVMAIEGGSMPFTANINSSRQNRRMCELQLPRPPGGRPHREWTSHKFLIWTPSTPPIWQIRRLPTPH
jgi:hypothetical protein